MSRCGGWCRTSICSVRSPRRRLTGSGMYGPGRSWRRASRSPEPGQHNNAVPARGARRRDARQNYLACSSAARLAIADLRLAAWFLWMTPLLAALSSLRSATRSCVVVASVSPESAASRNLRISVLSSDLTALLRRRAFSFCLFRLIWDLMFATKEASGVKSMGWGAGRRAHTQWDSLPSPEPNAQTESLQRVGRTDRAGHGTKRTRAGRRMYRKTKPKDQDAEEKDVPGGGLREGRGEPSMPSGMGRWIALDPPLHEDSGAVRTEPHRSRGDPQLLHHRAHRPRQVHARRPHAAVHRRGRGASDACPISRSHGHRARARHHDQEPGRAPAVAGPRPQPHRHPRARRLLL